MRSMHRLRRNPLFRPSPSFPSRDVVERVQPAVVSVLVRGTDQRQEMSELMPDFRDLPEDHPFRRFFREFEDQFGGNRSERPRPRGRSPMAQGSGFFISADGYVVTNNHVVSEADQIAVRTHEGEELDARLIGSDPRTDLALLKVDDVDDMPYVQFGDVDVRVGDWVLAVGNPFGLGGTVTAGIVSARGRDIGSGPYDDFLQIDAPVNRGNSGGPTFNLAGEVVGVNTAIVSPSGGNVGIAFAIPAAIAQDVIGDLRDSGRVVRGWLGIGIQPVSEDVAEGLGLSEPGGALVNRLLENSPAREAGVQLGDTILSVDGEDIEDARDLARTIGQLEPGHRARLNVWRDGREQSIDVMLGTQPETPQIAAADPAAPEQEPEATAADRLGFSVRPAEDGEGVEIVELDADSPAAERGLRPGDVVLQISGMDVSSPDDVADALKVIEEDGRDTALVLVRSERGTTYVAVPLKDRG
jgi:serine protease Do